jgi:hypothetical protein
MSNPSCSTSGGTVDKQPLRAPETRSRRGGWPAQRCWKGVILPSCCRPPRTLLRHGGPEPGPERRATSALLACRGPFLGLLSRQSTRLRTDGHPTGHRAVAALAEACPASPKVGAPLVPGCEPCYWVRGACLRADGTAEWETGTWWRVPEPRWWAAGAAGPVTDTRERALMAVSKAPQAGGRAACAFAGAAAAVVRAIVAHETAPPPPWTRRVLSAGDKLLSALAETASRACSGLAVRG